MKMKEKTAEVKFQAFDFYVRVIFSKDPVRSRRMRNKILGELPFQSCGFHAAHCWKDNEAVSYLFFPFGVKPSTIAHEAWHAISRMLRFCGAELDNETVAYHLGYLVDKIHQAAKR